jgi:hypothetical protein
MAGDGVGLTTISVTLDLRSHVSATIAAGRWTPPLGSLESVRSVHSGVLGSNGLYVDGGTLRNAGLVNILDGWPSGLRHRS